VRESAAALATLVPRDRLDPAVLRWTEGASRRATWSIACSGGPDSVALLLLIWAHWPERRRTLRVLHFDHRLRGAESRGDAIFCRKLAVALGVKFRRGAWAKRPAEVSEATARAARMAFLEKNGRVIWFGHQQDDVAESLLMRIARGSGAGGLSAPRPVHVFANGRVHLRPLLGLKKNEIVAALKRAEAAWRDDSSNAWPRHFRNRIRHSVLPIWAESAQRDAIAGAARARALLEEDDVALDAWLHELNPLRRKGVLQLRFLEGKPRGLLRRALHRWLGAERRAGEISRAAFDALLDALERRKATRHSLGRQGFAVTDGEELWFEPINWTKKKSKHFPRDPQLTSPIGTSTFRAQSKT
jgi:tRNA(Ile)-lysidine synthase